MKKSLKNEITLHSFVKIPVTNTLGFVTKVGNHLPWANEAEVIILESNAFYEVGIKESFLITHLKPTKIKYKLI